MRPVGVTNHFSRITIPDDPVHSDADFDQLIANIRKTMMDSIDSVMSCSPGHLVMGMSAETFWDGKDGSIKLQKRVEERAGVKVTMGSEACEAALSAVQGHQARRGRHPLHAGRRRAGAALLFRIGYEVVALKGLKCTSPMLIAHESEQTLRDAIIELNGPSSTPSSRSARTSRWRASPASRSSGSTSR